MAPAGTVQSSSLQHADGVGTQKTLDGGMAVGKGEGALEGIGLGRTDGELLG